MSTPETTEFPTESIPLTIKRLPIEYDQKINVLLNDIMYNANQAKAMCFVTDTMGRITATAKNTMLVLRNAIINGTEPSIVQDFLVEGTDDTAENYVPGFNNYAVLSETGRTLEIYRPYYSSYKKIGMLKIVENFYLGEIIDLSIEEGAESTDQQFMDAWNNLIEACGDNQRGF